MINLKTEEFVLDMNTLQALQQLLQWVGDFVLYLLVSLPNQVEPHPCLGHAHWVARPTRWRPASALPTGQPAQPGGASALPLELPLQCPSPRLSISELLSLLLSEAALVAKLHSSCLPMGDVKKNNSTFLSVPGSFEASKLQKPQSAGS